MCIYYCADCKICIIPGDILKCAFYIKSMQNAYAAFNPDIINIYLSVFDVESASKPSKRSF
jgi:hypothetical protein